MRDRAPRGRAALLVAALVVAASAAACSQTKDLGSSDAVTGTTIRRLAGDQTDSGGLAGGAEGTKQLQAMFDKALASNDPCEILTQKAVKGYHIDASTLASSAARQVLAQGLRDLYGHIIDIVPDNSVKPALTTQRDTFVEVVDIVERYSANPTSKQGSDQIRAVLSGPQFVKAQHDVDTWTFQHCS